MIGALKEQNIKSTVKVIVMVRKLKLVDIESKHIKVRMRAEPDKKGAMVETGIKQIKVDSSKGLIKEE